MIEKFAEFTCLLASRKMAPLKECDEDDNEFKHNKIDDGWNIHFEIALNKWICYGNKSRV